MIIQRAQEQAAHAQRQIDMHTGNLARLDWIIKRVQQEQAMEPASEI